MRASGILRTYTKYLINHTWYDRSQNQGGKKIPTPQPQDHTLETRRKNSIELGFMYRMPNKKTTTERKRLAGQPGWKINFSLINHKLRLDFKLIFHNQYPPYSRIHRNANMSINYLLQLQILYVVVVNELQISCGSVGNQTRQLCMQK